MDRLRFPILVTVLILTPFVTSIPAHADWCTTGSNAAYFDMTTETESIYGFGSCDIRATGASARIYVRALSIPFQKARLTIPDVPGVTVVNESWGVSFTGDHASGVELDMGSCVGPFNQFAPVVIGYMDVEWAGPANCTTWQANANAEVQDCNGMWRPVHEMMHQIAVTSGCGACPWQFCFGPLPAYDPEPANGATNVPLDVLIKWKYTHEPYWDVSYVRISTQPDCTSGGSFWLRDKYEFAPDFLEPGRTYYWQPSFGSGYDGGCQDTGGTTLGPIYSFTVEGVLAVEPTTWGRVKALYRN
jgi:hypothetical protein